MGVLLWILIVLFVSLPAVTYLVYFRRLHMRHIRLSQTLQAPRLADAYMKTRHQRLFGLWKEEPESKRDLIFRRAFTEDFKAQVNPQDYVWPVLLVMVLIGIGWFLTLHRIYPNLTGITDAATFLHSAFAYGFVGAFLASVAGMFERFRNYELDATRYYSISFRLLFSSTAAYLVGGAVRESFAPLVAFGVGLFPVEETWAFVTDRTAQVLGARVVEREPQTPELAKIQGLEDQRIRQKLSEANITTIQGLATQDPLDLFFRTTFPLRTITDWIDKAILYLYMGDKVTELRKRGINGATDVLSLGELLDKASLFRKEVRIDTDHLVLEIGKAVGLEPDEFKMLMVSLTRDPAVRLIDAIWGRY